MSAAPAALSLMPRLDLDAPTQPPSLALDDPVIPTLQRSWQADREMYLRKSAARLRDGDTRY